MLLIAFPFVEAVAGEDTLTHSRPSLSGCARV